MIATTIGTQKFFGLFELDAAGTVLYSRIEKDGDADTSLADVTGRNFYSQVASFMNVNEFYQRLEAFRQGERRAEATDFTLLYADGPVRARVLLARVRSRAEHGMTKSILVHIRKAA